MTNSATLASDPNILHSQNTQPKCKLPKHTEFMHVIRMNLGRPVVIAVPAVVREEDR